MVCVNFNIIMNIKGFGDYNKDDKGDDKKKKNDYYAGGKTSGIAVEGRDDLEKIVNMAKE